MKINDLTDEVTVQARRWRGDAMERAEWQPTLLHVERDPQGRVCLITVAGGGWAEYDPRARGRGVDVFQRASGVLFIVDDWCLEIQGLTL